MVNRFERVSPQLKDRIGSCEWSTVNHIYEEGTCQLEASHLLTKLVWSDGGMIGTKARHTLHSESQRGHSLFSML